MPTFPSTSRPTTPSPSSPRKRTTTPAPSTPTSPTKTTRKPSSTTTGTTRTQSMTSSSSSGEVAKRLAAGATVKRPKSANRPRSTVGIGSSASTSRSTTPIPPTRSRAVSSASSSSSRPASPLKRSTMPPETLEESETEDFESCASASEAEREVDVDGKSGDASDPETEIEESDFDTPKRRGMGSNLGKAADVFGSGIGGGAGNLAAFGGGGARTELKDGSSENIVVCVRVRPGRKNALSDIDSDSSSTPQSTTQEGCWNLSPNQTSLSLDPSHPIISRRGTNTSESVNGSEGYEFLVDRVFGSSMGTEDIYEEKIGPVVRAAMEGFNATVFAYGQTGSGKTFTMMGDTSAPGVIPRAISEVFTIIQADSSTREYLLRVSYLEIYNETLRDLLLSPGESPGRLDVRVDKGKVQVSGLKEVVVMDPEGVMEVLGRGEGERHVGATDWNERSSRSHTVFSMTVESRERTSTPTLSDLTSSPSLSRTAASVKGTRVSQLNLIDLAGSESAATSTERRKEGAFINKSLLALGTVIAKLSEGGTGQHIPYRDSKLTRLLQTSLGGNAKVVVVCTVSADQRCAVESVSTLRFARRAKMIVTKAERGTTLDNQSALLQKYQAEIQDLRNRLAANEAALNSASPPSAADSSSEAEAEAEEQRHLDDLKTERQRAEEDVAEMQLQRVRLQEQLEHLNRRILTGKTVEANVARRASQAFDSGSPGRSLLVETPRARVGRMSDVGLVASSSSPSFGSGGMLGLGMRCVGSGRGRLSNVLEAVGSPRIGTMEKEVALEKEVEEAKRVAGEKEDKIKVLENELGEVNGRLETATSELESGKKATEEHEAKVVELEISILEVQHTLHEAQREKQELEEGQEQASTMAAEQSEKISKLEAQIVELQTQLDLVRAEKVASDQSLEEKTARITALETDLEDIKSRLGDAESARDLHLKTIEEREQELEAERKFSEEMKQELEDATAAFSASSVEAAEKLSEAAEERDSAKQEVSTLKEDLETERKTAGDLKVELENAATAQAAASAEAEEKLSGMVGERDSAKLEVSTLEESLEAERTSNGDLKFEIEAAAAALATSTAEAEAKLGEVEEECDSAKQQVSNLEEELEGERKASGDLKLELETAAVAHAASSAEAEAKLSGVEEERDSAKQQVSTLEEELGTERSTNADLKSELETAAAAHAVSSAEAEAKLGGMQEERDSAQQQVSTLEEELVTERTTNADLKTEFDAAVVAHTAATEEAETKLVDMQGERDSAQGKVSTLEQELEAERKASADLKAESETAAAAQAVLLAESEAKVCQVEEERDTAKSQIASLEGELEAERTASGELKSELDTAVAAHAASSAEAEAKLGSMQEERDSAQQQVSTIEEELVTERTTNDGLKSDLEAAAAAHAVSLEEAEAKLGGMQEERDSAQQQVSTLEEELEAERKASSDLKSEFEAAAAAQAVLLAESEAKVCEVEEERDTAKSQISSLEGELEAERTVSGELKSELDAAVAAHAASSVEAEAKLGGMQDERDSAQQQVSALGEDLATERTTNDGLKLELEAAAAAHAISLEEAEAKLVGVQEERDSVKQQVSTLEEELEAERKASSDLKTEFEAAAAAQAVSLAEVEAQLGKAEGERDTAKSQVLSLEEELETERSAKEALKVEFDAAAVAHAASAVEAEEKLAGMVEERDWAKEEVSNLQQALETEQEAKEAVRFDLENAVAAHAASSVEAEEKLQSTVGQRDSALQQVSNLEQDLEAERTSSGALKSELDTAVAAHETSLAEAQAKLAGVEEERDMATHQVFTLEGDLGLEQKANCDLKMELDAAAAAQAALSAQAEEKLWRMEQERDLARQEVSFLEQTLAGARTAIGNLRLDLDDATATHAASSAEMEERLCGMGEECESATQENSVLKQELEAERKTNDALQLQLNNTAAAQAASSSDAEARLSGVAEERDSARLEVSDLRERLGEVERLVRDAQDEARMISHELGEELLKKRQEMELLKGENRTSRAELDDVRAKFAQLKDDQKHSIRVASLSTSHGSSNDSLRAKLAALQTRKQANFSPPSTIPSTPVPSRIVQNMEAMVELQITVDEQKSQISRLEAELDVTKKRSTMRDELVTVLSSTPLIRPRPISACISGSEPYFQHSTRLHDAPSREGHASVPTLVGGSSSAAEIEIERLNRVIESQRNMLSDARTDMAKWQARVRSHADIIARIQADNGQPARSESSVMLSPPPLSRQDSLVSRTKMSAPPLSSRLFEPSEPSLPARSPRPFTPELGHRTPMPGSPAVGRTGSEYSYRGMPYLEGSPRPLPPPPGSEAERNLRKARRLTIENDMEKLKQESVVERKKNVLLSPKESPVKPRRVLSGLGVRAAKMSLDDRSMTLPWEDKGSVAGGSRKKGSNDSVEWYQ